MKQQPPNPAPSDPHATETLQTPLPGALDPSEIPQIPLDSEPEDATQALPVQEPGRTAEIAPALLPDAQPAAAFSPRPPAVLLPGASWKPWIALALCLLAAGGGAAYWYLRPEPDDGVIDDVLLPLPPTPTPESVPPELRSYMDQAKGGDARAMHMIALMYWNGLNVRQDRVKGLDWYRKSAAAGDKAAQKELDVIEGK